MGAAAIVSTIGELIATPVKGWIDKKRAETEGEVAIKKAKVQSAMKRAEQGQKIDAEWETLQIKNAGWKDDWHTILLSIPVILCFTGELTVEWVRRGFEVLDTTPDWFQYLFGISVLTSFGIKKLKPFINKGS